jgi:hypothetical protein
MVEKGVCGDGEAANRAKRRPLEGWGVRGREESMKVLRSRSGGEVEERWGVGHEKREGAKLL